MYRFSLLIALLKEVVLKRVLKLWPLAVAVIVALLNIDLIVAPFLTKKMGLVYGAVFSSIIGTVELFYWYWFTGWIQIPKFASKFLPKANGSNRIERWSKRWGKMTVFILGAMPEPSMRAAGLVMCRSLEVSRGLLLLAIGNVIHIFAVVGLWKLFFSIFS